MEQSPRRLIYFLAIFFVGGGVVLAAFFGGVYFGYENRPAVSRITELINKEAPTEIEVDFSSFWRAWRLIDERYANGKGEPQERVWGAIDGLVGALDDPYSVFLPPEEKRLFEEEIQGNFGGVGMEIGIRDKVLTVIAPLPGTPAKRAGIMTGDQIIEIDGQPTVDLSVNKAVQLIRGEVGTSVDFKIRREAEPELLSFKVVRATIEVPSLETELLPEGVFVIRLFNFGATAPNAFRTALREFINSKTNKLIIDLRGNPGGYLESAVEIASWFLPLGEPVVSEDRGAGEAARVYRSRGYDIFTSRLKLAILVDQGSASASEILAGALREHGRAKLVGETTFGKGSVQELIPLNGDGALKLTIARWLTPQGHDISKAGLEPEVAVEWAEGEDDPQLTAAIKLLNGEGI